MMPISWGRTLKSLLPWRIYWLIKRTREEVRTVDQGHQLTTLAKIYGTDKWGRHQYTPVYQKWFSNLRHQPIKLFEIGIGGNDQTNVGGNSLRMWRRYFPKGIITGLDLYDKSAMKESRIRIYQGDQTDPALLKKINTLEGPFDIIIDDGSHIQSHILITFETLFPLMVSGGIYVIEDTQTSYLLKYGGSRTEKETTDTAMNYFRDRVHDVNVSDWKETVNQSADLIGSISFYHNLIFITRR